MWLEHWRKELPIIFPLRDFFSRQPLSVTRELLCRISAGGPNVTRRQIEAIDIPTLVVGHARDFVHPLAMAQELAAMIPLADMVEITPKADNKELYRKDFKAALSAFLQELQP